MSLIPSAYAVTSSNDVSISTLPTPVGLKILNTFSISDLLTKGGINLLNLIFVLVGLFFFVNIVLAGWDYMMSSGDPKKVATATTRIQNGFVGLIMAITAFVVVRIVTTMLGLGVIV